MKELRLLAATPSYFMNACIGYVLVLVAAVAVAVGSATVSYTHLDVYKRQESRYTAMCPKQRMHATMESSALIGFI